MGPTPPPQAAGGASKAVQGTAPSTEPPERVQGRLSLSNTLSGDEGLLAQGAPAAAAALQQAQWAAGGGGGGARGPPLRHVVLHREIQLDVPEDQVGEAVAAIVHMQPLPTSSARASPALPSSPRAGVPPPLGVAGGAADQQLQRSQEAPTQPARSPSPAAAFSSGAEPGEEPQTQEEREERGEDSYLSATSTPLTRSSTGSSGASSPTAAAAAGPPGLWQLEPAVDPPPRPSGAAGGGSGGRGSPPGMPAGMPPEQWSTTQLGEQQAEQPDFERSESKESEGLHAPPPTPASPSVLSPAVSAALAQAASGAPAGTPAPGGAVAAMVAAASKSGAPPGHPSAPASPSTPLQLRQAPPLSRLQRGTGAAWVPAGQPVTGQQGTPPGPGSWPGASPPPQQQQQPEPQGSWPVRQRSRLAEAVTAEPAAPELSISQPVQQAVAPPSPSTGQSAVLSGTTPSVQAPAASSRESRAAPAWWRPEHPQRQRQRQQEQAPRLARSGSADEPQETEIRGPWPPPPPAAQSAAPAPQRSPSVTIAGRQGSPGLGGGLRSAFQQASLAGQEPTWRRLDDGSWEQPGGEVDWEGGGVSPAAEALLHDSLVDAAAHSPPLSPTTTRLLALHHPHSELRRGPLRAASLGHGLSLPERQPSQLSPERQPSRPALSLPGSPSGALPHPHRQPPAAASSGRTPSWPAPQPSLAHWQPQQAGDAGPSRVETSNGSSLPPWRSPQADLLPVLNTSPDVAASSVAPVQASPFRSPSATPDAAGSGGGHYAFGGSLGGLPVGLGGAPVEKRERQRPWSPREAHGALPGYDSSAESPLRRPLLPASGARLAESSASEWDEEGAWVSSSPRRGSGWWLGTAVLTTSMLGAGLVAVPRAFALLGLVPAGLGLLAAALCTVLGMRALLGAAPSGSRGDYAAAARAALGPAWGAVSDAALAGNTFGLMVAGLVVAGDILCGDSASPGLLGGWVGDRAIALGAVSAVVLAPLLCFRSASARAGASMLAVVTSVAWAATLVALTAVAASQHDTYRLRLWPHWRQLGGGSRPAGWFAAAVQLLAAAPVLLVACFCHAGLQPAVRHLRPASAARTRSATAAALAYACALAVLLALCACALFGGGVAADALLELSPDALASLVGEPAGQAAFLLLRLPFLVSIVAGLPLLMGPFRDSLWRLLFWAPLLAGPGFLLVTLLALAAAVWASLQVASLWGLLSALGGTTGALLALVVPGLAALSACSGAQRAGGALLAVAGLVLLAASLLRLALFPAPA